MVLSVLCLGGSFETLPLHILNDFAVLFAEAPAVYGTDDLACLEFFFFVLVLCCFENFHLRTLTASSRREPINIANWPST